MVWRGSVLGLNLLCSSHSLLFLTPFLQCSLPVFVVLENLLGWAGRGTCSKPREKQISLQSKKRAGRSGGDWQVLINTEEETRAFLE